MNEEILLWEKTKKLFEQGEIERAYQSIDPMIERGCSYEIMIEYSKMLINYRKTQKATWVLNTLLSKDPDHLQAHFLLANIDYKSGHYELALKKYQRILSISPFNQASGMNAAFSCCKLGRFEESLSYFSIGVVVEGELPPIWHYNYGMALLYEKEPKKAKGYLGRALEFFDKDGLLWFHYGLCCELEGSIDEAKRSYEESLRHRDYGPSKHNLALLHLRTGDKDKALMLFEQIVQDVGENQIANVMYSALRGEELVRLPKGFVQALFDQYAFNYDLHLASLMYEGPRVLRECIGKAGIELKAGMLLDAGCGTGMALPYFIDLALKAEGVDLSGGMLAQAKKRACYDRLIEEEILTYLLKVKDYYDYIIACELANYLGRDLSIFIRRSYDSLRLGGILAITFEEASDGEVEFSEQARFKHSQSYISEIALAAGFEILIHTRGPLRKHEESLLEGIYLVLRKPLTTIDRNY